MSKSNGRTQVTIEARIGRIGNKLGVNPGTTLNNLVFIGKRRKRLGFPEIGRITPRELSPTSTRTRASLFDSDSGKLWPLWGQSRSMWFLGLNRLGVSVHLLDSLGYEKADRFTVRIAWFRPRATARNGSCIAFHGTTMEFSSIPNLSTSLWIVFLFSVDTLEIHFDPTEFYNTLYVEQFI